MAKLVIGNDKTVATPAFLKSYTRYGADVRVFLGETDSNGVLAQPSSPKQDLDFSGVIRGEPVSSTMGCFFRRFQNLKSIGAVSFPDLIGSTQSGGYLFNNAFRNSTITSFSAPKLTSSNHYDYQSIFYDCKQLTSINMDSINSVYYVNFIFNCFCYGCTALYTVRLPNLGTIIGISAFELAFANSGVQNIYFDSLRKEPNSNPYGTEFKNMLQGVSGCTLHFPKNLDPQTGNNYLTLMSGYPNLGGTNTVVSFDLPSAYYLRIVRTGQSSDSGWTFSRRPLNDTSTALGWGANGFGDLYTSGLNDPVVNDTIYWDAECTNAAGTIISIE